ncbi:8-oxoguanine DNA glycosylase OGG fold protein [Kitasatospora griseola]|uniref:8-oxoguanine DNA glycosylase OGG fold protein n=1 Tax=Kitasatospora griseola TaxID=2064 RepID=UPI00382A224C
MDDRSGRPTWTTDLDDRPQTGCWPRVDRHAVFALARRAETVEANRQLLAAALVWGSGTKAREVKRRGRIFARNSVAELDARLGSALTVLREEGAVAAYRAFNNDHRMDCRQQLAPVGLDVESAQRLSRCWTVRRSAGKRC